MAAFYPAFLADSVFSPNNNEPLKNPGYWDEFFPDLDQIYAFHQQGSSINTSANGSLEQLSNNNSGTTTITSTLPVVTQKQRSCESFTSSMAGKADSGEQVTQILAPLDHTKRKFCHGSPSNSANSKEVEEVKCKRQKGSKGVKNDKKGDEEAPKGYIHVRARRGQATDSHSLAERARREKISQKMKTLQALVPGCDKVNGKALMLDEIISYVQSLQNQVEFLSMKLASVDPMVYVFGLMNQDAMISEIEGTNNSVALPMQSTTQSNGSSLSVGTSSVTFPLTNINNNSAFAAAFPDVAGDNSASFFQDEQKPIIHPLQDSRSSFWGLDDLQQQQQENNIISNQFGFGAPNNNLYSFQ